MKLQARLKKLIGVVVTVALVVAMVATIGTLVPQETYAAAPTTKKSGDIYVAPNGTGSGTSSSSPTNLATAVKNIKAGNTIWMASGTYSLSSTIVIAESNAGTSSAKKTIAPLGGKVVLDYSSMSLNGSNRGIVLDGSYWHIYGLTIKGAGDNGMLLSGDNNTIEMCVFTENRDTGLQISRYQSSYNSMAQWPTNNLIKNCTSYNNCDSEGENADGFAAKLTCGEGNVFDGCMAYNNSDDGWDLYAKKATGPIGVVTIKNSIAFRNGKLTTGLGTAQGDMNGFKLGGSGVGTPHIVENCIAFENGAHGFTDNNNPTAITLKNCTSFDNSKYASEKSNYSMYRAKAGVNTNILSFKKSSTLGSDSFVGTIANSIHYNNSGTYYYVSSKTSIVKGDKTGTSKTISTSDFVSLTAPGTSTDFHTAWRNADGSINTKGFLEVSSSSSLVKLASDGKALGARLSGASSSTGSSSSTGASSSSGSSGSSGSSSSSGSSAEKETENENKNENENDNEIETENETDADKENEKENVKETQTGEVSQNPSVSESEGSTSGTTAESSKSAVDDATSENTTSDNTATGNSTEGSTSGGNVSENDSNKESSATTESEGSVATDESSKAVVDTDTDDNKDNKNNGSNVWIYVIIAIVVVAAGGAGGFMFYRYKKNQ